MNEYLWISLILFIMILLWVAYELGRSSGYKVGHRHGAQSVIAEWRETLWGK